MSEPFGIELAVRQCESGTASATAQKAVAARFRERTSKLVRASVRILDLLAEIARLREERKPVVLMPLPFEPWRHGPLSYRKCEMIAALKKAGVKWRPLPPGPEGVS